MQSAGSTQRGVRQLGQWAAAAAKAIGHTVKAAVSGLFAAGGGVVALILLLLLIMVGAIAASPFGILFSNESSTPDAVPISAAIAQVNYNFNARLEALQSADTYDDVTIAGEMADWVDVLAIFAVKTAGSNDVDATDVVTMDADRVNRLKAVFSDMNTITSTVETIHHADSDPDDDTDDSWTEKILHITITGSPHSHQDGLFSCRQGQLLLGRQVPCDGLGQPLGYGAKGHGGRQFQHRNLPPIRSGLQRLRGLGVLQRHGRQPHHWSWWRCGQPAYLLHSNLLGRRTSRRSGILSR